MVKAGYKQTEVGVIPEDWKFASLADLVKNNTLPSGLYKEKSLYGSGTKIIKLGDVFKMDVFDPNLAQRAQLSTSEKKSYQVSSGDIFIALASVKLEGVGKVMFVNALDEDTAFDHNVALIRSAEGVVNQFLFYSMKSNFIRSEVAKNATQVGTSFLKASTILKFCFPLPCENEQKAIATALSDVDGLIGALEKQIAKKRDIKTATMQQLLTGKKRLPGFGEGKGYKQTELGLIPEDWNLEPLGKLLKIRHGKSQKEVIEAGGKYPILATGGEIGRSNTPLYSRPSVLIGRKGTIDIPYYMDTPFWTVDTLFYSEVADSADAKFLYYKFLFIDWYQYNEASGVPSLNAASIEKILQVVPFCKKEQTAIAEFISTFDSELQFIEAKFAKAKAIKQGMMQELLTGRTRLV